MTFDKGSCGLCATCPHMTLNIFTKFYEDTTITYQVMARTSFKMPIFYILTSMCDLDLWHRIMGLIRDTPTYDTGHFHKVLWRYNNNIPSYGPDKLWNAHFFTFWPLSVTLTFDIGPWVLYATRLHMTLDIYTKFYEDTTITYQVMARTSFKMPIFYILTSKCDLDLWHRVMGLIRDTLTHDTGHFHKVLWRNN